MVSEGYAAWLTQAKEGGLKESYKTLHNRPFRDVPLEQRQALRQALREKP